MLHLPRLFVRAVCLWWRELLFLLVLNFVWLVAQLTVVFGPPMTAALAAVAAGVADEELVGPGDVWRALRENFGRAWLWGAAQLAVYGVLAFNLWVYRAAPGALALALRYAWTLLGLAWFAINLYYWPLNLAQTDRRFFTTLSNAAKMALLNPGFTIAYTLMALLFYRRQHGVRDTAGRGAGGLADAVGHAGCARITGEEITIRCP